MRAETDGLRWAFPKGRTTVDEALARKPFVVRAPEHDVFDKITRKEGTK